MNLKLDIRGKLKGELLIQKKFQPPNQKNPTMCLPPPLASDRHPPPHASFYGKSHLRGGGGTFDVCVLCLRLGFRWSHPAPPHPVLGPGPASLHALAQPAVKLSWWASLQAWVAHLFCGVPAPVSRNLRTRRASMIAPRGEGAG